MFTTIGAKIFKKKKLVFKKPVKILEIRHVKKKKWREIQLVNLPKQYSFSQSICNSSESFPGIFIINFFTLTFFIPRKTVKKKI